MFGGSALFALLSSGVWLLVGGDGALPSWAWFVFVLGLDVAHVWSTLFRTYLDVDELRRRPLLYMGLPALCYVIGVALYRHSAMSFWRVLAYAAVFHFVRQQVGWVAIYRARAGQRSRWDRWIDDLVIYAATGFPLLYWHAHLPRNFHWMSAEDFVGGAALGPLVLPSSMLYLALVGVYVHRSWRHVRRGGVANTGKHVVVISTAAIWLFGIVATNHDFVFTVTNVTVHAVPYFALVWAYARERAPELPGSALARIVGMGLGAFLAVALGLAFVEELMWERLVWHDRPGWFGGAVRTEPLLPSWLLALVVPALALPQAVHYALDGLIWRSKDAGRAQARALGFRAPSGPEPSSGAERGEPRVADPRASGATSAIDPRHLDEQSWRR